MSATHRSLGCVLAAALLAGCADRAWTPTQPPVTSPGRLNSAGSISDGAHGGNAHFFFLPPLVAQPAYKGTFDASLAPEVTICEWTGTTCAAAAVASYTTTSGTGGEIVRASSSEYAVNWDTDLGTTLGRTYRVRVTVAGTEIGYSDVLLVTNGRDAKNLTTGDVVALVYGRILPLKFRIERGAVAVVGATGGTAVLADGAVALGFSPGAVSSEIGVTATPVAPGTPAAPDNSVLAGTQYEFQPSPTTFQQPVTLTLSYPATLPPKWHADRLVICKIVGDACQPLSGGSVDTQTRTVSATISGFSGYAVREFPEVSYTGFDNGAYSIFLHTSDGERELARGSSIFNTIGYESWAPDGSRLVYWRSDIQCGFCVAEIRIISMDANTPERTLLGPGRYFYPQWSPDGARILVTMEDWPSKQFLVVSADGSEVRTFPEVAARMSWVETASWSSDGQRIFFSGAVDGTRNSICAVNVDGTGFVEILPGVLTSRLAVSPDGSRLAFTGYGPGSNGLAGFFVVNVDGTGLHQIAVSENPSTGVWSLGTAAVVVFVDNGPVETPIRPQGLYLVSSDGGPERALALGSTSAPEWSPDGRRLVFVWAYGPLAQGGAAAYLINADGSGLQLLGDGLPMSGGAFRWRP